MFKKELPHCATEHYPQVETVQSASKQVSTEAWVNNSLRPMPCSSTESEQIYSGQVSTLECTQ